MKEKAPASSEAASEIVITLIHGTFAKDAEWTQPDKSKLCAFLRERFPNQIRFERPVWDSRNWHKSRYEASRNLLDMPRQYGAPHFVIAHSHGGTVLAYALRDDTEFASSLAGVAFLSTPFIQARERLATRWILALVPLAIAIVAFAIAVMLSIIALGEILTLTPTVFVALGVSAAVAVASYAITQRLVGTPEGGLPPALKTAVNAMVAHFDLNVLSSPSLAAKALILRANADEAFSALSWAHFVSRVLTEVPVRIALLPNYIWEEIYNTPNALGRKLESMAVHNWAGTRFIGWLILFALLGFSAGIPIMKFVLGEDAFEAEWPFVHFAAFMLKEMWSNLLVEAAWLALAAIFISLAIAVLAIPTIALLFRVFFGRWMFLQGLFVELSVEATPPGHWCIHQLGFPIKEKPDMAKALALTHSRSYDDPDAHKIIAEWIRERVKAWRAPVAT